MLWDRHDLDLYERWLASLPGAYALTQECRLLEWLTSAWPRRGRTLLEIGCGPGFFLEFLPPGRIRRHRFRQVAGDARGRQGTPRRQDGLQPGRRHHLPYDNDSYDYVALLTLLEFVENPRQVLVEASRVARRGVLVGYVNRFSLYRLSARHQALLSQANWFTPWGMRALARSAMGLPPIHEGSVLPGPYCSWKDGFPFWGLGRLVLPIPIGAYCAFTADLTAEPPLTPLAAFAGAQPTKSF